MHRASRYFDQRFILAGHLCAFCGERLARFYYRGSFKADRSHDLCLQCHRSLVNPSATLEIRPWPSGQVANASTLSYSLSDSLSIDW